VERLSGGSNALTRALATAVPYAPWLLAVLAIGSVVLYQHRRRLA
jgi:hypothetical protein